MDDLLLVNVREHCWDTGQYLSEVLVAAFEESEQKTRKDTGRCSLGHALHCLAQHRVVSETCVLFAVNAFWAMLSGCVATVSTLLVSQRQAVHEPVPCAQMMELCNVLEELHVEFEDLPLEQYRARDELPLIQLWARCRADNCVTLPADLETMDLVTTSTLSPTLRAAEPRRLQNDSEEFFGIKRPQLISSAEIALPLLTSWDLLVIDKPADARFRSDNSTEQVLAETTRP